MSSLSKLGGVSALVASATYIFGFAIMIAFIAPSGYADPNTAPLKIVEFLVANQALMSIWNMVIYILNAIVLAFLAVALFERIKPEHSGLAYLSLAFGVIWSTLVMGSGMLTNVGNVEVVRLFAHAPEEAANLRHTLHVVSNGLGGGNEIVGGVWAAILGIAGLKTATLSKPLSIFAVIIGGAGIISVLPAFNEAGGAIFGLGFIVWFAWAGLFLLRKGKEI